MVLSLRHLNLFKRLNTLIVVAFHFYLNSFRAGTLPPPLHMIVAWPLQMHCFAFAFLTSPELLKWSGLHWSIVKSQISYLFWSMKQFCCAKTTYCSRRCFPNFTFNHVIRAAFNRTMNGKQKYQATKHWQWKNWLRRHMPSTQQVTRIAYVCFKSVI